MKAKVKPRIDLENRTKLQDVIPIETPFIVFIDPSEACNFKCKFCPTGDKELMKSLPGRGHGLMDFDLYKHIIDDLCTFPGKVKVVRLYKDGEPLLNPRFADMVKYAKDSGCCDRVDTTTNASLLTPKMCDDIIAARLDRINISVEGVNANQYQDFSGWKLDYDAYVDNIRYLYEHKTNLEMLVKINGDVITKEQQQQFLDTFGDITDDIFIESIMDCWPTFEQKKVEVNVTRGIFGNKIEEVLVCPYVFYAICVNSDGTVSLCFLDWKHELILGDVQTQSLKDIWRGDKLKEYRKMFLRGKRKSHPVCADCGQLRQGAPDDIDAYRDELLERLG